jgi:hypothetical protein
MDTSSNDLRGWAEQLVADWPALTDRQAALIRDVFATVETGEAA